MLRSLLVVVARLFTPTFFELCGAVAIVAGVWLLAGIGWALIMFGALALVKSFDLAMAD